MSRPAATPERPNILLITTDQQRHDAMGLNRPASPLRTANMDWLAAGGTNFSRAYTTCPVCIPARRTLLTGLHPTTHGLTRYRDGVDWDPDFTVPGLLSDHGYQTQLIGKLHMHPQRKRYGFDNVILSESPSHRPESRTHSVNDYTDWLMKQPSVGEPNNSGINGNSRLGRPFNLEENLHQTSWTADQAIDFFSRRDPTCPYFLHLSFWAPHPPLIPPQAYWDLYKDYDGQPNIGEWAKAIAGNTRGKAPDAAVGPFDPEEIRRATAGYFGLIHHIDDRIRAVLERCFVHDSPRQKEPTLILFTSDHGEMLGDHQLFRKSLPYEASSHVPLFINAFNMGMPAGQSDELVCLEDVAATIIDAAGIDLPEALRDDHEGTSLMPIVRGERAAVRDWLFGQIETFVGASHYCLHGPLKYIRFQQTHEEQLFDVLSDPHELHDLSADTDRLAPYRDALDGHLKRTGQDIPDRSALKPCQNHCPSCFINK